MSKKTQKMTLFLLIFAILPIFPSLPLQKHPSEVPASQNVTEIGFKTEVIENVIDSVINDTLISEISEKAVVGNEVEVIDGDYNANETKTRVARKSYGGGHSHSHSYGGSHSHSYGGGHHLHIGGIHHHHHFGGYGGSSSSYYGGSNYYGDTGYYGGYYGGYGGYGYGYGNGYGNGYYGYGNTYYGANTGLVNLCLTWAWGCSITNYRA